MFSPSNLHDENSAGCVTALLSGILLITRETPFIMLPFVAPSYTTISIICRRGRGFISPPLTGAFIR